MVSRRNMGGVARKVGSLLGFLALSSCAQVLGEFEVEEPPEPSTTGSQDILPSQPEPSPVPAQLAADACEAGQIRCNGQDLEVCVRFDTSSPSGWLRQQDCLSPQLCEEEPSPHCVTRGCDRGETACIGATPASCKEDLTDFELAAESCPTPAHCSNLETQCPQGTPCCLADPCTAGQLRCNQNQLQRCRDDQTDWDTLSECVTSELCLVGLTACEGSGSCSCTSPTCTPGETRCNGNALEVCNAGQSGWDLVETCATPELCELGRGQTALGCQAPACDPQQHECTEAGVLRRCRQDRTGFEDVDVCASALFCDPIAQRCEQPDCIAGEQVCNGAQIQQCRPDRTGFDNVGFPCASAALCDDGADGSATCRTPACDPGDFSCFGTRQLQTCNADRTAFVPVGPPCLRADLCSGERQRCDTCVPGRRECTFDLTISRTCDVSGNFFVNPTPCPLGCIANSGLCVTCTPGEYRCAGGNLQRCAGNGLSFTPLNRPTDCSGQTQVTCVNNFPQNVACGGLGCNPQRNECNECSPGDRRCQGADGFQECIAGQFGATEDCPGRTTCQEPDATCENSGDDEDDDFPLIPFL